MHRVKIAWYKISITFAMSLKYYPGRIKFFKLCYAHFEKQAQQVEFYTQF